MHLEDGLKNLQITKRLDKLFNSFELDKNGLISTKLIMELLTGNKKYDIDEKFDKETLIKFIESIKSFYVVGSTEWACPQTFFPDTWIEINEDALNAKIKALECYNTEVCEYPNPRSLRGIENLAKFTGNQCCMEYAESFVTVRNFVRK